MYTIYRIENSKNMGPYLSDHWSQQNALHTDHEDYKHPGQKEDIDSYIDPMNYYKFYCACPSKQLLYKWFYGWVTKLKKENFFVVKITVSNYIMGNSGKQCFFKQEDVISKEII